MKLKLVKITVKPFILIFSTINVITGFLLGALVTIMSLLGSADDQSSGALSQWAILIFPIANGILGLITGAMLTGLFNFLAEFFGGLELEFKQES